jgi:hypothetical protein
MGPFLPDKSFCPSAQRTGGSQAERLIISHGQIRVNLVKGEVVGQFWRSYQKIPAK